jgi:hypothetical protein
MQLTNINSKRRLPVVVAVAAMLSATLALGAFSGTANAEGRRDEHRGGGWDHRGWGGGGYYRAPPVVYGSPYYYAPPPVVYGPGFGINLNIR